MPNQVVLVVIFSLRYVGRLGFRERWLLKRNTFSKSLVLHQPYHPRAGQPSEGPVDVYVSLRSLRTQLHIGEVRVA